MLIMVITDQSRVQRYRVITLMMTILVSEAWPRAPNRSLTWDTWSPVSHVSCLSCHPPRVRLLTLVTRGQASWPSRCDTWASDRCWANCCILLTTTKNFLMKNLLDDIYLTTCKIDESGWMVGSWHKTRKNDSFILLLDSIFLPRSAVQNSNWRENSIKMSE